MRAASRLGRDLGFGLAVASVLSSWSGPARAESPAPSPAPDSSAEPRAAAAAAEASPSTNAEALRAIERPSTRYAHFLGSLEGGTGLRFNNPYRLATQLGASARSVSLTSSYLDLGFAAAFGKADGVQHGAALHLSFALTGVGQQVLTPSYFIGYGPRHRFLVYGRLGPSFVLAPDPTGGAELAGGFAWFLAARVALAGELVGDVYYGAGTLDKGVTTYPILSGQLGLLVDYELLP